MGGKEFHYHNLFFKHWNVQNPAEKCVYCRNLLDMGKIDSSFKELAGSKQGNVWVCDPPYGTSFRPVQAQAKLSWPDWGTPENKNC